MYGETRLCEQWFPSRIIEIDATMCRSTIIGSPQAVNQNIVGIDLNVPKDRAKLLEEPKASLQLSTMRPFGNITEEGHKHRRRVSSVPNEDTILPIKPNEIYPGITEDQIDLLDHCLKKVMQRAGKIGVTWKLQQAEPMYNIQLYYQEVDDGTCRFQARTEYPFSLTHVAEVMCSPQYNLFGAGETEVLESFKEFLIMRSITPLSRNSMVSKREIVYYSWNVELYDVIYRVFTSVEPDDVCGYGRIDSDSGFIRALIHPGTGFILKSLGNDRTECIVLWHFEPNGWLPFKMVQKLAETIIFDGLKRLHTEVNQRNQGSAWDQ